MSEGFYVLALCVIALALFGLFATAILALFFGRSIRLQARGRIQDGKPTVDLGLQANSSTESDSSAVQRRT